MAMEISTYNSILEMYAQGTLLQLFLFHAVVYEVNITFLFSNDFWSLFGVASTLQWN